MDTQKKISQYDYLFFDTECSDGNHLCSFGYIITDSDFNIREKKDIIINPKAKIYLNGRRPTEHFKLGYEEQQLRSAPTFNIVHKEIKTVLEKDCQIIVGHSARSDLMHLKKACEDNEKHQFKFKTLDTQKIYKDCCHEKNDVALFTIAKDLGINETEDLHTGLSGANDTLKVFVALVKKFNLNVEDLLSSEKYIEQMPIFEDKKATSLSVSVFELLKSKNITL